MTQEYIGVDLHKAFFHACAIDRDRGADVGGPLSADG